MFWSENRSQVVPPLTKWPRRPVVCWRRRLSFYITGKKCLALGSVEEKSFSSWWILFSQLAERSRGTAGPQAPWGPKTRLPPPDFSAARAWEHGPSEGDHWKVVKENSALKQKGLSHYPGCPADNSGKSGLRPDSCCTSDLPAWGLALPNRGPAGSE